MKIERSWNLRFWRQSELSPAKDVKYKNKEIGKFYTGD